MRLKIPALYETELPKKGNNSYLLKKSLVEIWGTERILIENHLGILQYSDEMILVRINSGTLEITGENLCIQQITKIQLVIFGQLEGIRLNRRK